MIKIGYHASHEQHPPSRLLNHVRLAEEAGFSAAMCSDHFHPWSERQGESGFSWAWLGAAMQATSLPFGVVCAPGQRYHPAIIAQAAATLAEMFPGRFWIAVGSGEALNECITGQPWPDKAERNARLKESVDILRALWAGEVVNHYGLVCVKNAKLYTRPEVPPKIIGAAISAETAETAEWLGGWADGLITVGGEPEDVQPVIEAFRQGGGEGKPMFLQTAHSYAPDEPAALAAAHDQWRHAGVSRERLADLATPWEFDAVTAGIQPEDLLGKLRISSDLQQHLDWLQQDIALGFSEVYLHTIDRNVERFLDAFGTHVLPSLTRESVMR